MKILPSIIIFDKHYCKHNAVYMQQRIKSVYAIPPKLFYNITTSYIVSMHVKINPYVDCKKCLKKYFITDKIRGK